MTQLAITTTELVEDGASPIVRCRVTDTAGHHHELIEKLAILSRPTNDATIACLILATTLDQQNRQRVTVDISCPWACQTTEGLTTLEVFDHQLLPSEAPWIAIANRPVPATLVGTNDGLGYGKFHRHPPIPYQAILPIACLDWFAPKFAALADEMRDDDQHDDDPSPFAQIDWPRTLPDAANHPSALAEIVEIFCDRQLLAHHFPFNQQRTHYVINSTDAVHVLADQIIIRGRCFRYQSSSNG